MSRPSRRGFLAAVGSGGVLGAAGCLTRGSATELDLDGWPPPETDDELSFWTWQHYWGGQAIAFQHTFGIEEIDRDTVGAPEQLRRLEGGETPDAIHLPTRQFHRAMEADLLRPLPTDVMPSWPPENRLRSHELSFYESDGEYYGLPQTPLAFSLAIHSHEIDRDGSWDPLWNEAHSGRIEMPADPVLAAKIAALHVGEDPDDPDDVGAIRDALAEQRPLVGSYWNDWYNCWRRFDDGETVAAALPQPRMCLCAQDETPIIYDSPDDGVLYSQNVLAIPSGAENANAAAAFLDWGADFKTGTETGWDADEWELRFDSPLDQSVRAEYEAIAADLEFG